MSATKETGHAEAAKDKIRLNLALSQELNQALDEMASELQSNRSEVVRRALSLLIIAHQRKKKGEHIGFAKDPQKLDTEIVGAV